MASTNAINRVDYTGGTGFDAPQVGGGGTSGANIHVNIPPSTQNQPPQASPVPDRDFINQYEPLPYDDSFIFTPEPKKKDEKPQKEEVASFSRPASILEQNVEENVNQDKLSPNVEIKGNEPAMGAAEKQPTDQTDEDVNELAEKERVSRTSALRFSRMNPSGNDFAVRPTKAPVADQTKNSPRQEEAKEKINRTEKQMSKPDSVAPRNITSRARTVNKHAFDTTTMQKDRFDRSAEYQKNSKESIGRAGEVRGTAISGAITDDPKCNLNEVSLGMDLIIRSFREPGSMVRKTMIDYLKKNPDKFSFTENDLVSPTDIKVWENNVRFLAYECFNNSSKRIVMGITKITIEEGAVHNAFVRVHDGATIKMHPLIAKMYNADFDGDATTVSASNRTKKVMFVNPYAKDGKLISGKLCTELLVSTDGQLKIDMDFWHVVSWGNSVEEVEQCLRDIMNVLGWKRWKSIDIKSLAKALYDTSSAKLIMEDKDAAEGAFKRVFTEAAGICNREFSKDGKHMLNSQLKLDNFITAMYNYNATIQINQVDGIIFSNQIGTGWDALDIGKLDIEYTESMNIVKDLELHKGSLPINDYAYWNSRNVPLGYLGANPYFRLTQSIAKQSNIVVLDKHDDGERVLRYATADELVTLRARGRWQFDNVADYYATTEYRNTIQKEVGLAGDYDNFDEFIDKLFYAHNYAERQKSAATIVQYTDGHREYLHKPKVYFLKDGRWCIRERSKNGYLFLPITVKDASDIMSKVYGDKTAKELFGRYFDGVDAEGNTVTIDVDNKYKYIGGKNLTGGIKGAINNPTKEGKYRDAYPLPAGWETMTMNSISDRYMVADQDIEIREDYPHNWFDLFYAMLEKHAGDKGEFSRKLDEAIVKQFSSETSDELLAGVITKMDGSAQAFANAMFMLDSESFQKLGIVNAQTFAESYLGHKILSITDSDKAKQLAAKASSNEEAVAIRISGKKAQLRGILYSVNTQARTAELREAIRTNNTLEIQRIREELESISPLWEAMMYDFFEEPLLGLNRPLLDFFLDPDVGAYGSYNEKGINKHEFPAYDKDAIGALAVRAWARKTGQANGASIYSKCMFTAYDLMVKPGRDEKFKNKANYLSDEWSDIDKFIVRGVNFKTEDMLRAEWENAKEAAEKKGHDLAEIIAAKMRYFVGGKSSLVIVPEDQYADALISNNDQTYHIAEKGHQMPIHDAVYQASCAIKHGGMHSDLDMCMETQLNQSHVDKILKSPEFTIRAMFDPNFKPEAYGYRGEDVLYDKYPMTAEGINRAFEEVPRARLAFTQQMFVPKQDSSKHSDGVRRVSTGEYVSKPPAFNKYLDKPSFAAVCGLFMNPKGKQMLAQREEAIEAIHRAVALMESIEDGIYRKEQVIEALLECVDEKSFTIAADKSGTIENWTKKDLKNIFEKAFDVPVVSHPDTVSVFDPAEFKGIKLIDGKFDNVQLLSIFNNVQAFNSAKTQSSTGVNGNESKKNAFLAYFENFVPEDCGAEDIHTDAKYLRDNWRDHEGMIEQTSQMKIQSETIETIIDIVGEDGDFIIPDPNKCLDPLCPCVKHRAADRTTNYNLAMQASPLGRLMLAFRALGTEAFNLKVKKMGLDNKDSISKFNANVIYGSFNKELEATAKAKSIEEAREIFADVIMRSCKEQGYDMFNHADCINLAHVLLYQKRDGSFGVISVFRLNAIIESAVFEAYITNENTLSSNEIVQIAAQAVLEFKENPPQARNFREFSNEIMSLSTAKYTGISVRSSSALRRINAMREIAAQPSVNTEELRNSIGAYVNYDPKKSSFASAVNGAYILGQIITFNEKYLDELPEVYKRFVVRDPEEKKIYSIDFLNVWVNETQPFKNPLTGEWNDPDTYTLGEHTFHPKDFKIIAEDPFNTMMQGDASLQPTQDEFDLMDGGFTLSNDYEIDMNVIFGDFLKHIKREPAMGVPRYNIVTKGEVLKSMADGVFEYTLAGQNPEWLEGAIQRWRASNKAIVDLDGYEIVDHVHPGEIIGWAKCQMGSYETYAPLIVFPIGAGGTAPENLNIEGLNGGIDAYDKLTVSWTFSGGLERNSGKVFENMFGGNKTRTRLTADMLGSMKYRRLRNGLPINFYVDSNSTASRRLGLEKSQGMASMSMILNRSGYSLAEKSSSFVSDTEMKQKVLEGYTTLSDWAEFHKSGKKYSTITDVDDFVRKVVELCLTYNTNPQWFLAPRINRNGKEIILGVSFDHQVLAVSSDMDYVNKWFKFFHHMDPEFCPNGLDAEIDGEPMFDKNFKMLVPFETPDGRRFEARAAVYAGFHFYSYDYTGFHAPGRTQPTTTSVSAELTKAHGGATPANRATQSILEYKFGPKSHLYGLNIITEVGKANETDEVEVATEKPAPMTEAVEEAKKDFDTGYSVDQQIETFLKVFQTDTSIKAKDVEERLGISKTKASDLLKKAADLGLVGPPRGRAGRKCLFNQAIMSFEEDAKRVETKKEEPKQKPAPRLSDTDLMPTKTVEEPPVESISELGLLSVKTVTDNQLEEVPNEEAVEEQSVAEQQPQKQVKKPQVKRPRAKKVQPKKQEPQPQQQEQEPQKQKPQEKKEEPKQEPQQTAEVPAEERDFVTEEIKKPRKKQVSKRKIAAKKEVADDHLKSINESFIDEMNDISLMATDAENLPPDGADDVIVQQKTNRPAAALGYTVQNSAPQQPASSQQQASPKPEPEPVVNSAFLDEQRKLFIYKINEAFNETLHVLHTSPNVNVEEVKHNISIQMERINAVVDDEDSADWVHQMAVDLQQEIKVMYDRIQVESDDELKENKSEYYEDIEARAKEELEEYLENSIPDDWNSERRCIHANTVVNACVEYLSLGRAYNYPDDPDKKYFTSKDPLYRPIIARGNQTQREAKIIRKKLKQLSTEVASMLGYNTVSFEKDRLAWSSIEEQLMIRMLGIGTDSRECIPSGFGTKVDLDGTFDISDTDRISVLLRLRNQILDDKFIFEFNENDMITAFGSERVPVPYLTKDIVNEITAPRPGNRLANVPYDWNKEADATWDAVQAYMTHNSEWSVADNGARMWGVRVLYVAAKKLDGENPDKLNCLMEDFFMSSEIGGAYYFAKKNNASQTLMDVIERTTAEVEDRKNRLISSGHQPYSGDIRSIADEAAREKSILERILQNLGKWNIANTLAFTPMLEIASSIEVTAGNSGMWLYSKLLKSLSSTISGKDIESLSKDAYAVVEDESVVEVTQAFIESISSGTWDNIVSQAASDMGISTGKLTYKDYRDIIRNKNKNATEIGMRGSYALNKLLKFGSYRASGMNLLKKPQARRFLDLVWINIQLNPDIDITRDEFENALMEDPKKLISSLALTEEGRKAALCVAQTVVGGAHATGYALNKVAAHHPKIDGFIKILEPFYKYAENIGAKLVPMSNTIQYLIAVNVGKKKSDYGDYTYNQFGERDKFDWRDLSLAIALDLSMGFVKAAPLMIGYFVYATLLGIEPPDDEDKVNVYGEWKVGGKPIAESWIFRDVFGFITPAIMAFHVGLTGKGDPWAMFVNGATTTIQGTPWETAYDLLDSIMNWEDNLLQSEDELDKSWADAPKAWSSEWIAVKLGMYVTKKVGRLLENPLIASEYRGSIIPGMEEPSHSASHIYDENGEIVRTSWTDAQLRKITRNNYSIAAIVEMFNLFSGKSTNPQQAYTSYFGDAMPFTVTYDSAQMALMDAVDITDTTTESEKEERVLWVISQLQRFSSAEEAAQNGLIIPYRTRVAVNQYLYDKQQWLERDFKAKYYARYWGSDYDAQSAAYNRKQQMYEDIAKLRDRLYDDTIPYSSYQYLQWKTNYRTLYRFKDTGEPASGLDYLWNKDNVEKYVEAIGDHKSSADLTVSPDTRYDTYDYQTPVGWQGSLTDPNIVKSIYGDVTAESGWHKGENVWDVLSGEGTLKNGKLVTGDRALIVDKQQYLTDKEAHDAFKSYNPEEDANAWSPFTGGKYAIDPETGEILLGDGTEKVDPDKDTNKTASRYPSYSSGGGSRGGYSSSPNIYSRASSSGVSADRAATMYSKTPSYTRFSYLSPRFETKGSREAYKRQDI